MTNVRIRDTEKRFHRKKEAIPCEDRAATSLEYLKPPEARRGKEETSTGAFRGSVALLAP